MLARNSPLSAARLSPFTPTWGIAFESDFSLSACARGRRLSSPSTCTGQRRGSGSRRHQGRRDSVGADVHRCHVELLAALHWLRGARCVGGGVGSADLGVLVPPIRQSSVMWFLVWVRIVCWDCPPIVDGPFVAEWACLRYKQTMRLAHWDRKGVCYAGRRPLPLQPHLIPDFNPKHRLGSPSPRPAVNRVALKLFVPAREVSNEIRADWTIEGALVLPPTTCGMIEASITAWRSPAPPTGK